MELNKILSMSTGHITENDAKLLESEQGFTVGKYEEGFFIFTNVFEMRKQEGYSEEFYNLVLLAKELDCRFMNIDRDADYIPGLPTFEW